MRTRKKQMATELRLLEDDDRASVFNALSNSKRRAIIQSLVLHTANANQLAGEHNISVQAIYKHLKILKMAGLIHKVKNKSEASFAVDREALLDVQAWIDEVAIHVGENNPGERTSII